MVRVVLPGKLSLTCPHCRGAFDAALRNLSGCRALSCVFCGGQFNLYDALSPMDRRRVYHAVRDELERQVYEKKLEQGEIGF
jgi:hypothetical protein